VSDSGNGRGAPEGSRTVLLAALGAIGLLAVAAVVLALTLGRGDPSGSRSVPVLSTTRPGTSSSPSHFPSAPTTAGASASTTAGIPAPTSAGASPAATGCGEQASALRVAVSYVVSASFGLIEKAQACVYQHSVPSTTAQSLQGKFLLPTGSGQPAGDGTTFRFTGSGATASVRVVREPDSRFWVTGVVVS
jgi:hypothetical protein